MKNKNTIWMTFVMVIFMVVVLLLSFHYRSSRSSSSPSPNSGSNPQIDRPNPEISSSLSVVPKSKGDSDLVVEHHYKATIDGEVVNIPIRTIDSGSVDSPDVVDNGSGVSGASSYTAHYKQELDLTPLLSDYEHKTNWEVGAGIGSHDGDVYYPVSVQRNLSHDRAVEGVVHINERGKVNGGEVLYKARF